MDSIISGPKLYNFMMENMKNHNIFDRNLQFYNWVKNLLINNKQRIIDIELVNFFNKENMILISKIPELLKILLEIFYKMCYKDSNCLTKKNYLINMTLYTYFSIIDLIGLNENVDHKEINLLGYNLILLVYNDIFMHDNHNEEPINYNDLDDCMTYIYNPDSF